MPIAPSSRLCIMGYLVLLYTILFFLFFWSHSGNRTRASVSLSPHATTTDSVLPLYDTALPCYALSMLHFAATTATASASAVACVPQTTLICPRRCLCPTNDTLRTRCNYALFAFLFALFQFQQRCNQLYVLWAGEIVAINHVKNTKQCLFLSLCIYLLVAYAFKCLCAQCAAIFIGLKWRVAQFYIHSRICPNNTFFGMHKIF